VPTPTSTLALQPLEGAASFFWTQPYIEGCSFCLQPDHHIRMCPVANKYVHTGRAKVMGDKLRLPNNQRIPNDSSGCGIKASIDAWLTSQATAQAATQATTVPPPSCPTYAPPPLLPPQHALPTAHIEEVAETNILQVTQITQAPEQDQHEDDGLNIFQVFAAEKKRRDSKAVHLADLTEAPSQNKPPAPPDPHAACSTSQYRYHSNAEDQQLVSELYSWLMEGKLSLATPAHILAASPTIRKELAEKLKVR
jgi:hypothetical protein